MALIEIQRNPSAKELRWFGLLAAAFFGIAGLIARLQFGLPTAGAFLWGAGLVVPVVYYLVPSSRRPIYLGWMYAAFPIGWTVSHVLLGAVYFLLFTAIGMLLRLLGKDPLSRRIEPEARTYWVEHRPCSSPPRRYFRQF